MVTTLTPLTGWQNFYAIVGASAGALIGLQFVVLSLVTNRPTAQPDPEAGPAFATPTIIHFGTVLGLSGIMSAPWDGAGTVAILWGIVGLSGVVYIVIIIRRMRAQTSYRPEFEDWLFHVVLPIAAYLTFAVSAWLAQFYLREALFGVGAAVMLLLFIGIHNAWDAVTYHLFAKPSDKDRQC